MIEKFAIDGGHLCLNPTRARADGAAILNVKVVRQRGNVGEAAALATTKRQRKNENKPITTGRRNK